MKTNNKISAYILRGSTAALLFSCVIVALCSAINLSEQPAKAFPPQSNTAFGANAHQSRSLSFADRVAYQRAIEEVYWRHRIWPDTNPDPKPSLDAVMSHAQLEKKVTDYLRNSQALEDYWQKPLTAEQLQAEMDRMAQHTKQPEVLRELFEALGNDPFVIAECLARPILSERLKPATVESRNGPLDSWRAGAENQMSNLMAGANASYTLPTISDGAACSDDTWTATSTTNAPDARAGHTAVWTGSEMIVWGGGASGPTYLNTGGRYNPSTDSWIATTTTNAPAARYLHTAVWTGSEMIVWGGYNGSSYLNTGGRYNPGADSWTATSTTNAPAGRQEYTAVWTGSEMIVWGGYVGTYLNTGRRYNPTMDSWTATSTTNAPQGRYEHTAIWTGSEMIVWGGFIGGIPLSNGGRYNPGADSWTATSTTNVPPPRGYHTAVWTSSEMIIWGGWNDQDFLNTGGRYNPGTDTWTATSTANAPAGRFQHTAVWTAREMIVWGGWNGVNIFNTGGRYNPSIDSWTATSTTNAPTARYVHRAVWTGSEMIVWGGYNGSYLNTGGRYCAQPQTTPTPTPTPTTPTPTATPTPTGSPTPTPTPPFVNISGTVLYCSNPVPGPVSNVTMTLTGTSSGSTLSDGSGNYSFTGLPSGGSYTVTPTKAARAPGSAGINTVDAATIQQHFLNIFLIPPGCRLTAADVNADTMINTVDAFAVQRFYLGLSTGIANTGKYKFIPVSRSYLKIVSDQTAQDYDTLVFGDTASSFVESLDSSSH